MDEEVLSYLVPGLLLLSSLSGVSINITTTSNTNHILSNRNIDSFNNKNVSQSVKPLAQKEEWLNLRIRKDNVLPTDDALLETTIS
jgi:hypothetical protein